MVQSGESVDAEVISFNPISGSARLRLPEGERLFQTGDPAFGLIYALRCEMMGSESAQERKKRQIAKEFEGKLGTVYFSGNDDFRSVVLVVNETAVALKGVPGRGPDWRSFAGTSDISEPSE
ncbi:MAG: hypothetical protein K2Z81_05980 [Cyanobacteria bacterium]|nr:hypothetical protein [Cyanobacteriota bacterium]